MNYPNQPPSPSSRKIQNQNHIKRNESNNKRRYNDCLCRKVAATHCFPDLGAYPGPVSFSQVPDPMSHGKRPRDSTMTGDRRADSSVGMSSLSLGSHFRLSTDGRTLSSFGPFFFLFSIFFFSRSRDGKWGTKCD